MKRYSEPDTGDTAAPLSDTAGHPPFGVTESSSHSANGTQSFLRVLPRVGSSLITLEGPYLGQSFALSSSKSLTLGTRPDSDIVLARDETISQIHARIMPEEDTFVVYNVSATNGTRVNDVPVSRHTLEVGDVLQLGASKFRYE